MSEILIINKSEDIPPKTCVKKCFGYILKIVHQLIFAVGRWIFSMYYTEKKTLPPIRNPIILETAMSLAEKIRNKQLKSEDLLNAYIERIQDINSILNCFVEDRFREAMEDARNADKIIADGTMSIEQLIKEKPLLGVPFTTKDCIKVKGLHNTSGLLSRKNVVGDKDAESISLLRKAGAIPIGLTNVSELCMWWESHNRVHGRTNNAYDVNRIVGGSSGGEGCMQSAVGSAFGIGSDIGGSIRMPSFFNGIFGHKPSKFTVSNEGQYPAPVSEFQNSFLGSGPMVRKASDLKPLLKIIAGNNAKLLRLDENVDLKKIKVYYQTDCLNNKVVSPVDRKLQKLLVDAAVHLSSVSSGKARRVEFGKMILSSKIWLASMNIKDSLSFMERLTGKNSNLNLIFEIIKSICRQSQYTFVALMTAVIEKTGAQAGSKEHNHMLKLRQELEDEFRELLGDDGVFLYPTHPTAALYHNEPLIRLHNFNYTSIINVLGFPATHIPMGLNDEGLPIGIQVISNWNNDRLCLAVAEELEKKFGGWIDPSDKKKDN